jgi:phosphoglycolate phosphatase-like HAD superfamily hydrolase
MKSSLIVFDIDGTLTDTNEIDGLSFSKAMSEVFGIHEITTDWADYEHTTDSGILRQLLRESLNKEATPEVLCPFKKTFISFFESAQKKDPHYFSEVPGASKIFEEIFKKTDWGVSIATGAWEASARFKLNAAGVPSNFPAGFAEDSVDRKEIIKTSIERAKKFYNQAHFNEMIYVGDGIWDLKSAEALGMGFIGIDVKGTDKRLSPRGAHVLRDYKNSDQFIEAVKQHSRDIF